MCSAKLYTWPFHQKQMPLPSFTPALIIIDMQKGMADEAYYGGNRNNKNAEKNAAHILKKWRELKWPIFHVRHSSPNIESPLHASKPGHEIMDEVKPISGEPVLIKNVNSAFIGTDLKERLDKAKIKKVVIIGMTTNHCVSSTVRMADNYGYETILISDATAAFDGIGINGEKYSSEIVHQITLANLKDEFAEIMNTEDLMDISEI